MQLPYATVLTVIDDNGGRGTDGSTVEVDPIEALERTIDDLELLGDDAVDDALRNLVGPDTPGSPNSGALDRLEAGTTQAAMVKIGLATDELADAEVDTGFDASNEMVVMNSDHQSSRAMLHELGHFKQDLDGANEDNVYVYVLEYHNVLIHENLDESELRTSYGKELPANTGKTWADVLTDVADHPATRALLKDIGTALATPKYSAIADLIRANLVAEYFADAKGDRAAKKTKVAQAGFAPAPRVPKYT